MKKKYSNQTINLGIFFEYLPQDTGNFTQSFYNLNQSLELPEVKKFVITLNPEIYQFLKKKNINSHLIKYNIFDIIYAYSLKILSPFLSKYCIKYFGYNYLEKKLKQLKIDLVYFTSQSNFAEYLNSINYIYTIYDLAHLDLPEFPEFDKNIFKSRNRIFSILLKRATAVICESNEGYSKLIKEYNLSPNRLHISNLYSPLIDHKYLKTNISKSNDELYLLYPAAFWPHKNHVYLIFALSIILEKLPNLRLKFTGSENEHSKYIFQVAKELNVEKNVDFMNFQSLESLRKYICNSLAMVYPSYLWPSNIPPLEALSNNCPVFVGNSEESKAFLGSSVYYFDYCNPNSLAEKVIKLYENGRSEKDIKLSKKFILEYMKNKSLKETLSRILKIYNWKKITWQ